MKKVAGVVGASVGSWGGWWLGDHIGMTTAFFLGAIGAGVGMYVAFRLARAYLE